jgi:SWI/SNF-related matrix-associated actin-dependent regulator 1 of chromatin subfamily A
MRGIAVTAADTAADVAATPPSAELLAHAAGQVATAYPDLFAHQRAGVAFLLARRRAILADDMGLGKTRQAIVALREAAPAGPFLIVCPAAVKLNWRREIRLVEPDATVLVVQGGSAFEPGQRWTVVNYDLLGRLESALLAQPWAGIAVDEAHYVKNTSQRSARVLRLLGVADRGARPAADPEAVYLLTGTPMSNRPRYLFNLLRAVRHPLANSYFSYATRYCAAFDNGYGLDDNGAPTWRSWPSSSAACCCAAPRTRRWTCPPSSAPGSPWRSPTAAWPSWRPARWPSWSRTPPARALPG